MTIGQEIYNLRVQKRMNAKELGIAVGYGEGAASTVISAIESGRRKLPRKKYTDMARALGVSDDYFDKLNEAKIPANLDIKEVSVSRLPIFGSVAAGLGVMAGSDEIEGYYTVPEEWIKDSPDEYFLLRVEGDSMEPRISNGSLALVRKQTSVMSGSIAVVLISEDGTDEYDGVIKKVIYDKNTITLRSFNTAYDDRVFSGPDVLKVRVCGVVKCVFEVFE